MFRGIRRRYLTLVLGPVLAVVFFFLFPALPPQQRIMVSIFVLTVFYWVSEPVPLYATGIIAAFASAVLLGAMATFMGAEPIDYRRFLYPFASPVVVLLFGGFVMAQVFSKNYLDIEFSQLLLSRLGSRPAVVLSGMMLITALMSMWMSNTATTAIMVATVLPLVRKLPAKSNLGKALMLAIPFSANIGGIATPIGTTPNAIAIGLLAEEGIQISFVAWMVASFPVMIVTLAISFGLLMVFFPTRQQRFSVPFEPGATVANKPLVYTTFFVTIALWLTDVFHGIPAAIVALVPVAVFSVAGQLPKRQMREIPWDILLLIGGGLALGVGVKETGLGETIVNTLLPSGMSPLASQVLVCFVVTLLATFMSHTAATNIILPLALTVATAFPAEMAIPVAICASFGMALPVSTPPNAIAYGSDMIAPRDMLKVGALVSLVGIIVAVMYSSVVFRVFATLFTRGS